MVLRLLSRNGSGSEVIQVNWVRLSLEKKYFPFDTNYKSAGNWPNFPDFTRPGV